MARKKSTESNMNQVHNSLAEAAGQAVAQMQEQALNHAESLLCDFFLNGGFANSLQARMVPHLAQFVEQVQIGGEPEPTERSVTLIGGNSAIDVAAEDI